MIFSNFILVIFNINKIIKIFSIENNEIIKHY